MVLHIRQHKASCQRCGGWRRSGLRRCGCATAVAAAAGVRLRRRAGVSAAAAGRRCATSSGWTIGGHSAATAGSMFQRRNLVLSTWKRRRRRSRARHCTARHAREWAPHRVRIIARAVDRPQRHHVDRRIELVRAFRRAAGADVERRVAIDRHRLDRSDRRDHIIADVAQRLDDVRPFARSAGLERLAAAILPRRRGAQQLPGRHDAADLRADQIIVERLDLRRAPRRGEIPGAIAGLVLPGGDVGRGRVPRPRAAAARRGGDAGAGCAARRSRTGSKARASTLHRANHSRAAAA